MRHRPARSLFKSSLTFFAYDNMLLESQFFFISSYLCIISFSINHTLTSDKKHNNSGQLKINQLSDPKLS